MKIGIVILSLVATINSVLIKNRLYSLYSNNADRLRFNETKEIRFKEKISNNEVIIRQGWLKYLELSEDDNIKTAQFKKNPQNNNQHKNNIANDEYGPIDIPNEDYFYFELSNSKLSVYQSRINKQLDNSLYLSDIVQNGIEDIGNFIEGHCFIIKFIRVSRRVIWELCGDSSSNSISLWISSLSSITPMTPEQSPINIIPLSPNSNVNIPLGYVQNGVWSTCSKPCDSGIQYLPLICVDSSICKGKAMLQRICNIKACRKEVEDRLSSLKEVAEGHWESLGKWSECSKVCGGGVMTLQRRCVGNNCQGEATLTQPCNTLPCTILDPNKVQTMDVVFSVSKYDECRLLEGNLMMVVNNKKILSHMMVNVNEIMIYKKENGMSIPVMKVPLSEVKEISALKGNEQCFNIIQNTVTNHVFCSDEVDRENHIKINEWIEKIKKFKFECSKKIMDSFERELQDSVSVYNNPNMIHDKMIQIQNQLQTDIKNKNYVKEAILNKNFEEFKRQLDNVLTKEKIYEEKLKKEQIEKLRYEQEEFNKHLNQQKQIVNEMFTDINTISNEELKYKAKERAVQHSMKQMLAQAQNRIMNTRSDMLYKIKEENIKKDIENRKQTQTLFNLKGTIGKEMLSKMGNPMQCFNTNIHNQPILDDYCNRNFVDLEMKNNCKIPNQFCFMCCISELRFHDKEIECCYNKCDHIYEDKCASFESLLGPTPQVVIAQPLVPQMLNVVAPPVVDDSQKVIVVK